MRIDIINLGMLLWLRACGSVVGLVGEYVWEVSLEKPSEFNCKVFFLVGGGGGGGGSRLGWMGELMEL